MLYVYCSVPILQTNNATNEWMNEWMNEGGKEGIWLTLAAWALDEEADEIQEGGVSVHHIGLNPVIHYGLCKEHTRAERWGIVLMANC